MNDTVIDYSNRNRLEEIKLELEELKTKHSVLKEQWSIEKSLITSIRSYKQRIEELKNQSEEFERQGDLAKVAEIRYGTIIELLKKISETNEKLLSIQSEKKLLKEEVSAEDIAEIVAKWTGVPVQKMLETERTKLLKMEDRIHQRLINQNEAVSAIANAIRRSRTGLQDSSRPVGSFIFLGTTGVGKTEMARSLAEFLFDDESALVRFDMSEYMEKFSVSRLIGAPPGYVGYESGGQLTEAIRNRPYSVILLDEIEKAHSDVLNLLLQVLDEGRLTDGKGRTVNFRNTIIIMTSNLGTELIQEKITLMNENNRDELISDIRVRIVNLLKKTLRPEFLNRIDEVILFKPLTKIEILQVAKLQFDKLKATLLSKGIKVEISEDALDWLANIGYDPQFGARPIKRVIQKYIADKLAFFMLESELSSGSQIFIDLNENGGFIFRKQ